MTSTLGRHSLHDYQKNMVDFIKDNKKCALWVDMGLGKSVATLTAITDLIANCDVNRVLIIAPLRVAKNVWPAEIKKWSHTQTLPFSLVIGKREKRIKTLMDNKRIHIVSRDLISWLVEETEEYWPYDMVVIDESSSFKSSTTRRFKSLRKMIPSISRMVQLTGTPTSKGLLDLWPQFYLLDKGKRLQNTFTKFKEAYFYSDYNHYNFYLKTGSKQQIYKKIADLTLTLSAQDYLSLPKCIYNKIDIQLDDKTKAKYTELEREFILLLEDTHFVAANAVSLLNKLSQLCNGAIYDDEHSYHEVHTLKLDALDSIVNESGGEPLLIAYKYKSDKERIQAKYPEALGIDAPDVIERWNKGEVKMLCLHPQSCGHGLNLQAGGSTIVWFGITWSLELYQQFNARLYRQGQTKPVFIHHLVIEDSVDNVILDSIREKKTTQAELIDAMKKKLLLD